MSKTKAKIAALLAAVGAAVFFWRRKSSDEPVIDGQF